MKPHRFIAVTLCLVMFAMMVARAQDMDMEITKLTEDLAVKITNKQCKKVSVADFTDLEYNPTELGKYVADQVTVDFAMNNRAFEVLDRAHLKKIMDENKFTASGLVDPANVKQLGMLSGVDALVFGKVITIGNNVSVTVQIISTETGLLITGAKAKFKNDDAVQQVGAKPIPPAGPGNGDAASADQGGSKPPDLSDDKPQVVKLFGDLRVEVQSLRLIENGEYLLTMSFVNRSPRSSIWVALNGDSPGSITGAGGFEYRPDMYSITGVQYGRQLKSFYGNHDDSNNRFNPATQIDQNESVPVTVKFVSNNRQRAKPGICNLQLELLVGHGFDQAYITVSTKNLMTKLLAQ